MLRLLEQNFVYIASRPHLLLTRSGFANIHLIDLIVLPPNAKLIPFCIRSIALLVGLQDGLALSTSPLFPLGNVITFHFL